MVFLLQIVILDEAHNIEDSARSAASWQVTQDELQAAMQVDCLINVEFRFSCGIKKSCA
jgi:hypothetical protein